MPNPKAEAAKNLAKFLAESKEKNVWYHGSPIKGIKQFEPGRGEMIFFGPKETAESFGKNIYPSYLSIQKPFYGKTNAVELEQDISRNWKNIQQEIKKAQELYGVDVPVNSQKQLIDRIQGHDYFPIEESQTLRNIIKNKGFDSIVADENGAMTYGVFNPTQIKSAIGNRGTFNPLDPDITKAEGGKINPIKSPREMLFELAGLPAMAGGGTAAKGMYKLITDAIEKYTKIHGRPPSPEDVAALKAHAKTLEPKPISTDPATQARARYEMSTDPNLQNPDLARDPFLTKMLTGRTVKGTYLKPKTVDITDPSVRQSIDERQVAGKLDDVLQSNAPSITPGADYLSRMATGVENKILGAGKVPLIDKLKQEFYKKFNRFPSQEELDTIIAEFNPARHQYGTKGASIVGERPASRVGQEEWRANARVEGIPEAYLNKPPADYPQYLRDELQLQQGNVPGMKEGGLTADEMRAAMIAQGQTPSKLAPKRGYEQSWDAFKDFMLGMRDAPREVIGGYAKMLDPRQEVPSLAPKVDVLSEPQGRLIPFPGQGSAAYETGKTASSWLGDPVNLIAGPMIRGAKKASRIPLEFLRKNPVKASVMGGVAPAAIGSEYNQENK